MTFQQRMVINNREAAYSLRLVGGTGKTLVSAPFVFPVSPQAMDRQYGVFNNIYHVQSSQNTGVFRIFDQYGEAPPNFILRGTTGWNAHASSNYTKSGLTSLEDLNSLLSLYHEKIASARSNGENSNVTMELFDFFLDEAWEVMPIGDIIYRQSEQHPLWVFYELRLAALTDLKKPVKVQDTLWQQTATATYSFSNTPSISGIWQPVGLS